MAQQYFSICSLFLQWILRHSWSNVAELKYCCHLLLAEFVSCMRQVNRLLLLFTMILVFMMREVFLFLSTEYLVSKFISRVLIAFVQGKLFGISTLIQGSSIRLHLLLPLFCFFILLFSIGFCLEKYHHQMYHFLSIWY